MPPVSYKNVIGTIIHEVFEKVNKGELEATRDAIKEFWKASIVEKTNSLAEQFPTLRSINLVDYDAMFSAIKVAEGMKRSGCQAPLPSVDTAAAPQNEYDVKISGLLKGKIDRVDRRKDGSCRIVDYKTGNVFDEGGRIKQAYIDQLNLYAYMLEEQDGAKVTDLVIIDRRGQEVSVPYYPEKKFAVLRSVKDLLDNINKKILSGDVDSLYVPTKDNCLFCSVRHLCSKRVCSDDSSFRILSGCVSKVWNDDQIEITNSMGTCTIAKLRLLGLQDLGELLGKDIIAVNLLQVLDNQLYNRTDSTVVYIKETE